MQYTPNGSSWPTRTTNRSMCMPMYSHGHVSDPKVINELVIILSTPTSLILGYLHL